MMFIFWTRESNGDKLLQSLVILSLMLLTFDGSNVKLDAIAALSLVLVVVILS